MKFRKGTIKEKVYNLLLQHEYMKTSTIAEKLNIPKSSIAGTLTALRRAGLAEYSGTFGEDLHWKKHPINNPMYPSQPDIMNRENKKVNIKPEVTDKIRFNRVSELLIDIANEIAILRKHCDESVFIEHGEIGGFKIYRKSK